MRSHTLLVAALAALTDLGAVAAPVSPRGVNDANNNPSSLEILSNKIPSNIRLEASAFVLPSQEQAQSQQGTGVEILRTGNGDEDETVLRTHDVLPLGRVGGNRNLTNPLAGRPNPFEGVENPFENVAQAGGARAGGTTNPLGDATAGRPFDNLNSVLPLGGAAAGQPLKRAAANPLAGVQDLPGKAIKQSNAPMMDDVAKIPGEAIKQSGALIPEGPSPAGAVAATEAFQKIPAQAFEAAGGMIPSQTLGKRGTSVTLPKIGVDATRVQTDALPRIKLLDKRESCRRHEMSIKLPAVDIGTTRIATNALGLSKRDEGGSRAESRSDDKGEVEPRQIIVAALPRPRPRPSVQLAPIVISPDVRPSVGLRTMRRGVRAEAE